jgi:alkylation response protein AidB-like acyl-CoA dehydrogenase
MASRGLELARAYTAARSIGLARGALEDAIGLVLVKSPFLPEHRTIQ